MINRNLIICIVFISSCIMINSNAFANTDAGIRAFKNHDYKTAYQELIEPSEAGDPRAEARLGYMFHFGLGVTANDAKALELITAAANHGDSSCQSLLGILYKFGGFGVGPNLKLAALYLKKASDARIPEAQDLYADFLLKGLGGVKEDDQAAIQLLYASAKQNYRRAQWKLAYLYSKGEKVPMDKTKAFMYASAAAQQNYAPAQYMLARYYADGIETTKDPIKAYKLMLSSAQQNYPSAEYYLGIYLYEGIGTAKDVVAAKIWIQKAAAQGVIPAIDALTKI